MNSNNIPYQRISSRYIRRDSPKNISTSSPINMIKINKLNNNSNDNTDKNNVSQLSSYVIRSRYAKKGQNKEYFNNSSEKILVSTVNKRENLNHTMFYSNPRRNEIKINQPRTPLVSSINKIKRISVINNKGRNVQTPLVNSNRDFIKMNSLSYYARCPYCNHTLNQATEIKKTHFKKYVLENKENTGENLNYDIKYTTEKKSGVSKKKNLNKSEFKNFYINEKGVIVFKPDDKPTTSILIFTTKPDLSKYSNELKVFGKKKNIGIYEAPPPTKKVFVRPIKI